MAVTSANDAEAGGQELRQGVSTASQAGIQAARAPCPFVTASGRVDTRSSRNEVLEVDSPSVGMKSPTLCTLIDAGMRNHIKPYISRTVPRKLFVLAELILVDVEPYFDQRWALVAPVCLACQREIGVRPVGISERETLDADRLEVQGICEMPEVLGHGPHV